MNRIEFMDRLSSLLSDLPENERGEALQYYNDYLDDAGVENEQEVLEALGTPQQLADSIREGLREDSARQGEFSEQGFRQSDRINEEQVSVWRKKTNSSGDFYSRYRRNQNTRNTQKNRSDSSQSDSRKKSGMSTGAWILLIICCIFAVPILIPVAFALALTAFILIAVAIVVIVILLFSGVLCIAIGLYAMVAAITRLFVVPAGAMIAIGICLMVIGLGILLVLGTGWLLCKFFPTAVRGCVHFCSRIFHRKGGTTT